VYEALSQDLLDFDVAQVQRMREARGMQCGEIVCFPSAVSAYLTTRVHAAFSY
jgi:hypothetical protein